MILLTIMCSFCYHEDIMQGKVLATYVLLEHAIISEAYFSLSYNCIMMKQKILTAEYLALQIHSTHVPSLFNVWYNFKWCAFPCENCGQICFTGTSLEHSHYLGAEPCLQQVAVLLCYFIGWILWSNLNRSMLGLTSYRKMCQHLAIGLLLCWEYG